MRSLEVLVDAGIRPAGLAGAFLLLAFATYRGSPNGYRKGDPPKTWL